MIGLDFSCTFVLLGFLDGGHPVSRPLVHVIVGVYPHLVLDVTHVLQLLALVLLDALDRAATLDVRDREAELLRIVAAGGKGHITFTVDKLDGGIERGAEFVLTTLELLDRPEGRIGQLDEDQFLVVVGILRLMLLGQSIAPSAQGGHLERDNTHSSSSFRFVVVVVVVDAASAVESVTAAQQRESALIELSSNRVGRGGGGAQRADGRNVWSMSSERCLRRLTLFLLLNL